MMSTLVNKAILSLIPHGLISSTKKAMLSLIPLDAYNHDDNHDDNQ